MNMLGSLAPVLAVLGLAGRICDATTHGGASWSIALSHAVTRISDVLNVLCTVKGIGVVLSTYHLVICLVSVKKRSVDGYSSSALA